MRAVRPWMIALASGLLLAICAVASVFDDINGRAFDFASTTAPPRPETPGAIIIAIDEPSMGVFGDFPWPRDRHAALISALRAAGSRTIAFDILFAEPSGPEADAALIDALGPDVVLAADETLLARDYGTSLIRTEPFSELLETGAAFGVASLSMGGDGVLREMPSYPDGFMAETARQSGSNADVDRNAGRLIQYFGGAGSYPTVSYYQAIAPDEFLPAGFFQDQVVIVGLALQASGDVATGADSFETPFTLQTRRPTPGVEIQATILDNYLHRLAIAPAPLAVNLLVIALAAWLGLAASRPGSPWLKGASTIGALVVGLALGWLALRFGRVWVTPVEPALALALTSVGVAARDFAEEQRNRRQIQSAFGLYLSPEMVRKIADDPSLLTLGGERRDMSILFADIRGFTAISEAMKDDPQSLTRMINDIMTPLSQIVLRHGGTIDKFMGDCIMAFWNAPLDDADHALHAVQAGAEMVEAMAAINVELGARYSQGGAAPTVSIGVGVNTGDCVVGNLGSDDRFDYSVLGDAVNVASRLEGLSKNYDASLIIGEETAGRLEGRLKLRRLDDVSVRGRAGAQTIYTTTS